MVAPGITAACVQLIYSLNNSRSLPPNVRPQAVVCFECQALTAYLDSTSLTEPQPLNAAQFSVASKRVFPDPACHTLLRPPSWLTLRVHFHNVRPTPAVSDGSNRWIPCSMDICKFEQVLAWPCGMTHSDRGLISDSKKNKSSRNGRMVGHSMEIQAHWRVINKNQAKSVAI